MSTQVTNYQCPACTGPLHFVGASGKLECDYCGTTYDVAEIEAFYAAKDAQAVEASKEAEAKEAEEQVELAAQEGTEAAGVAGAVGSEGAEGSPESQWDTSNLGTDWGADAAKMKVYNCPSCGAELICDETTAATSCPYCGNPSIVPGQFAGALKPDYVLPFKLSKEDAKAALKKHYAKKPLLPKTFSNANHIEEIKGVYVPFWMFDAEAEGTVNFEATRSFVHRSGGYEIVDTDHFNVLRAGDIAFEKVPVDASSKMPDDYMDSIEPYDYSELKPFSTAYLPGFMADKYDMTVEDCYERADTRCKGSFVSALKETVVGYQTCSASQTDINLKRGQVHYALIPVWLLTTKWNNQNFLFAMNGQTGKFVGKLPSSLGKAAGIFAAIAGAISAIGVAALLLLW